MHAYNYVNGHSLTQTLTQKVNTKDAYHHKTVCLQYTLKIYVDSVNHDLQIKA
jgi:hypothetical protein